MASIFTKIIQGSIPSYKIAENDDFFAFLDINPVQKGHTLVVPKIEVDYIYDLDDQTLANLFLFSKAIAKAIESCIPCNRIGITVMGLEVPHAHVHLIPINSLKDMSFESAKLKFTNEEFENIAQQISSEYKKIHVEG